MHRRFQRRALCARDACLALRDGELRIGARRLLLGTNRRRTIGFGIAPRDRARCDQRVIARLVCLRMRGVGLTRPDHRRGRYDRGIACAFLRRQRDQCGLRGGDIGLRIGDARFRSGQPRVEFFGIDRHQRITRTHRLVVAHQHLRNEAPDTRRHARGVGGDIGIVGRFGGRFGQDPGRAGQAHDQRDARRQRRARYASAWRGCILDIRCGQRCHRPVSFALA